MDFTRFEEIVEKFKSECPETGKAFEDLLNRAKGVSCDQAADKKGDLFTDIEEALKQARVDCEKLLDLIDEAEKLYEQYSVIECSGG